MSFFLAWKVNSAPLNPFAAFEGLLKVGEESGKRKKGGGNCTSN